MINLLFGCAGSGKTRFITQKIKESIEQERRTYLLVPEQQVFTAEKILLELPHSAGLYFEIISFSRLCELVFGKFGGLGYTSVSGGVRNLIMWESIRQMNSSLVNYGKALPDNRLASLMLSTIDELTANSITAENLEQIISEIQRPDIKDKLSDISAIMTAYSINLEAALGEGAVASENRFERLYETLCKHDFFEGADVYVDSFTDFTGIQHKILAKIMQQANNTCISVNVRERGYHAPHTESATETVKKLTRAARESGQAFDDITLGGNTRTQSPQLKLLEKHIWDFSAKKSTIPDIPKELSGDIEMAVCENEYEETEYAALKILEARRNGMNYSDIAVILRNPEDRSGIINAVFSKYNIPFFISEKTGLTSTPVSRFILSSLRCISKNYRLDDVLTLLKTGLCGIDDKDADMFEEYCRTWNIQGSTFTQKAWSMNPNGFVADKNARTDEILASANKVRAMLIEPLEELKIKCRAAKKNATELCRALYSYMENCNLSERLCQLAELELELGGISNIKEAGEILRVYDALLSAISGLCAILGDTELTTDELALALEIMLSNTELASVPALGECVTIGSAATLRVEKIKLAIVMELCEGIFPSIPKDSGLLTESDKEKLDEMEITFKTRRARLMSDELFYVYRAMTKPSEKLIATTYTSSISGGKKTPSVAWHRLLTLFDLPVEHVNIKQIKELAEGQRIASERCELEERVSDLFEQAEGDLEVIPPEIIRATLGNTLYLSKSKIQNFVKCPMLYWNKHVLELRPRASAQISANESGTLIHYVLENLFREIRLSNGSLPTKTSAEILELTEKWVDKYVDLTNCPRTPSHMYAFSKLRNMAYLMANNVYLEFAASDFKMFSFEQSISNKPNALHPLEIKLSDIECSPTVYLGGNADRIDTYTKDGVTYIRVIDYKTGNVSFDASKIPTGADLQLPAYLFAIASDKNKGAFTNGGEIMAGASLYVSAVESAGDISVARSGIIYNDEHFLRASNHDLDFGYISTAAERAAQKDKLDSCAELFTKEQIAEMKEILTNTVEETGKQIYSGIIRRTPSPESCKYCPVRASCSVACASKY